MACDFLVLHGCGHSFHTNCLPDGDMICLICNSEIANSLKSIFNKIREGLTHQDNKIDEEENTESNECGDTEDADDLGLESEPDHLDAHESHETTILRLKQQIFSWGLIPGP